MQLDREMLTWQDLFMDIYMDILRQTAVRLGSVLSYFVLQAEGCCTNAPTEQELLQKFETLR